MNRAIRSCKWLGRRQRTVNSSLRTVNCSLRTANSFRYLEVCANRAQQTVDERIAHGWGTVENQK